MRKSKGAWTKCWLSEGWSTGWSKSEGGKLSVRVRCCHIAHSSATLSVWNTPSSRSDLPTFTSQLPQLLHRPNLGASPRFVDRRSLGAQGSPASLAWLAPDGTLQLVGSISLFTLHGTRRSTDAEAPLLISHFRACAKCDHSRYTALAPARQRRRLRLARARSVVLTGGYRARHSGVSKLGRRRD